MTFNSIRASARAVRDKQRNLEEIPAKLVDVDNEDGVSDVRVTDGTNLVWVLLYDENARVAQAYNMTTQYRAGAPVWVRKMPDRTLEVVRIRARDGTDFYGDAAPTINSPPLIGELMPDTLWPGRNLIPGRLYTTSAGGMTIYIAPFHYDGGYFPGGTQDLTANIPVTANKKAWVKVYVDPNAVDADDSIGATTGTYVDVTTNPMNEADLAAIPLDSSFIPVAGIVLENGQTAIDDTTLVVDARQWLNAPSNPSQYMPIFLDYAFTMPSNRQVTIKRLIIQTGGSVTILGAIDII